MATANRRGLAIFFLVFGICLVALTVALNVGWIFFSLERIALLILGIIFFAAIITGLVLNTIFLVREIRINEQQDTFLNAVTHELKTPIASIRLYLDTLKTRDVPPEKRQEFYDIMLKDSERLLGTVEQVLQTSRTRNRQRLLNKSNVNLSALLRECIERIQNRYHIADDAITITGDENVEINADRTELQAAFVNLLDNAVKYSGDDLKIEADIDSTGDKHIEIRIKDSGTGIEAAELNRIFRRFYRIPNLSTQTAKGTGLGLSIVRSVIEKHEGSISAESDGEGKGSTFIVKLPKI